MSYNIKLRQFGNGQVEIVHYGNGVRTSYDEESAYIKDIKARCDSDLPSNGVGEYHINPFTGQVECMTNIEDLEQLRRNEEHSIYSSLNRTRSKLYEYSRQICWDFFITLTFSSEVVDRYNFSECMKKARVWFSNSRIRKAPTLKYLIVPEQHKDGAWHIHGLIADTGSIEFTDSGKRFKNQITYNLSGWKYGFSTATKVADANKVAGYICKYITKELCAVTKGKNRYFLSNNIPKVKEDTFLIDPANINDFIQELTDSIGCDLAYEKDVGGYLNVNYKYYNKAK